MTSPAEQFWHDPPWAGGKTQFRMGLKEIPEARWLAEPVSPAEADRKRDLLSRIPERVVRKVPGVRHLEAAVVSSIGSVLARRDGFAVDPDAARIEQAALWVPDDLCLLSPGPQGYCLVSACLCSPSYWRLGEKIGKPMRGIHGPVKGLNEAVGRYVDRFMENLPIGRVFQRRNWLIHQSDALFHPDDERWATDPDPKTLFVRSETQTLRKFPGSRVLFTIRVGSHPLRDILDHPQAAEDMLAGIDRMNDDELEAFGYRHHGPALRRYLALSRSSRG